MSDIPGTVSAPAAGFDAFYGRRTVLPTACDAVTAGGGAAVDDDASAEPMLLDAVTDYIHGPGHLPAGRHRQRHGGQRAGGPLLVQLDVDQVYPGGATAMRTWPTAGRRSGSLRFSAGA